MAVVGPLVAKLAVSQSFPVLGAELLERFAQRCEGRWGVREGAPQRKGGSRRRGRARCRGVTGAGKELSAGVGSRGGTGRVSLTQEGPGRDHGAGAFWEYRQEWGGSAEWGGWRDQGPGSPLVVVPPEWGRERQFPSGGTGGPGQEQRDSVT